MEGSKELSFGKGAVESYSELSDARSASDQELPELSDARSARVLVY